MLLLGQALSTVSKSWGVGAFGPKGFRSGTNIARAEKLEGQCRELSRAAGEIIRIIERMPAELRSKYEALRSAALLAAQDPPFTRGDSDYRCGLYCNTFASRSAQLLKAFRELTPIEPLSEKPKLRMEDGKF